MVHTGTILKFGGLNAIRNAAPILLGITIRDAICLGLWKMYGIITNRITLVSPIKESSERIALNKTKERHTLTRNRSGVGTSR